MTNMLRWSEDVGLEQCAELFANTAIERAKLAIVERNEAALGESRGLPAPLEQALLASDDTSCIAARAQPVDGGNAASLHLPGTRV